MTDREIHDINCERLENWATQLTAAHATPLLMVGVGHDAVSGQLHILHPENVSREMIAAVLTRCLQLMWTPGTLPTEDDVL